MTAEQNPIRICIVEDDRRLADLTKTFLSNNGYRVSVFHRGDDALKGLIDHRPQLLVLDWMLPGMNGTDLCREVRKWFRGPIMMLTAKSSDFDQVIGLELGADDYIIKPVEPHVLLARIKALLRRSEITDSFEADIESNDSKKLTFGELSIDQQSQTAILERHEVSLTSREFQLLWLLASNAGKIVSREEIFFETRGLDYDGLDRSVDVRISKLRKKLLDQGEQPTRIKTIWGKGYLFVPSAWEKN